MSLYQSVHHPLSVDAWCLAVARGETTSTSYRAWLTEQRRLHPEPEDDIDLLEAA